MKLNKLMPLYDKILIKPVIESDVSEGGILLPDSRQRERPQLGTVLAVGAGFYEYGTFVTPTVKIGNKVMYGRYAGIEIEIDGDDCVVMPEKEILLIVG